MRVLLTGGTGQVGTALRQLAPAGWEIEAPDKRVLDLLDPASVERAVAAHSWDAVINAAAYTAVDRAELESVSAWRVNALGPAVLAHATAQNKIPLVHLSTDYVFDGKKTLPYTEEDSVCPLNVYGASKEGGEQAVRTGNLRHVILRTAWVVSPYAKNFIKTLLRLSADGSDIRVVNDQIGNPTSAADVALVIATIVNSLVANTSAAGTYHFVNSGRASRYDLAKYILDKMNELGMPTSSLEPVATAEYPTAAVRPACTLLSTAKLQKQFGIRPRSWRKATSDVIDELLLSGNKVGTP